MGIPAAAERVRAGLLSSQVRQDHGREQFVAAMLYCVPDTWISCFSTGQRASTTLLDQAARFFNTLPRAKDKILKKNQEQFFTRGVDGSDVRRFHSFPSSVAGLKGQGALVGSVAPPATVVHFFFQAAR